MGLSDVQIIVWVGVVIVISLVRVVEYLTRASLDRAGRGLELIMPVLFSISHLLLFSYSP